MRTLTSLIAAVALLVMGSPAASQVSGNTMTGTFIKSLNLTDDYRILGLFTLLTGVTIGVTTAVILGLGGWIRKQKGRREQTKFVRRFLTSQFSRIREQQPLPPLPSGESAPLIDSVRWVIYQGILRDLEVTLSYRLTMLDYGKIHELQSNLAFQRNMIQSLFREDQTPSGLKYYRQRYEEFQKLAWLKLPPHLFSDSNE